MMINTFAPLPKLVQKIIVLLAALGLALVFFCISSQHAEAASLRISPSTGVYSAGATFSVSVLVDTAKVSANAAEGTITFNPKEVSVVSVNRSGSIFSLWVTEPTFSNSAGTISFSGGSPAGYTGGAGTIMTITLRAVAAGAPRLNFSDGAVLANDGKGTNVLTGMSGGTYTIGAPSATPMAEQVIEYVAPANTPGAPSVTSSSHADPTKWYTQKEATLIWALPTGVTAVRTSLDDRSTAIPTKVYESPIKTVTLTDLPEGVSYFHIQFKNEDGWGKVTHYRLAVDTGRPSEFTIALPDNADLANPQQTLLLKAKDDTSKIARYMIKIDNEEPFEFLDSHQSGSTTLPALTPGYHAFVIEAFDEAGNGLVSSFSLTISSFEKPVFTEFPNEINDEVIPVLRGTTRPKAQVEVFVNRLGAEPTSYTVTADDSGTFTFIPEGTFSTGVYEITARAKDSYGAQSELSSPIRIAVQQPGFLRIGSLLVSVLSVIISLLALIGLSVAGFWLLVGYVRRLRQKIAVETREAVIILKREFESLEAVLTLHEGDLLTARKGAKLTKAEVDMVVAMRAALKEARARVEKEVVDVDRVARGGEAGESFKK